MTQAPVEPIAVIECGCCCCWHRAEFTGDCRNDAERFASPEQAANRLNSLVQVAYLDISDDPEIEDELSLSGEIVQPGSDDI